MLEREQFEGIAKQWIEQNKKGHEAQESLASWLQQMYRHGVVDSSRACARVACSKTAHCRWYSSE